MVCYIFMHIINDFVQNDAVKVWICLFVSASGYKKKASCSSLIPPVTQSFCPPAVTGRVWKDPIRRSSLSSYLTGKVVCLCPWRASLLSIEDLSLMPYFLPFFAGLHPKQGRSGSCLVLLPTVTPERLHSTCCWMQDRSAADPHRKMGCQRCQRIENVPTSATWALFFLCVAF